MNIQCIPLLFAFYCACFFWPLPFVYGQESTSLFDPIQKAEIGLSLSNLNSSNNIKSMSGIILDASYFVHQKIQLLNSTYLIERQEDRYTVNDFRLRLWGPEINSWHPGLAMEVGHLYSDKDWLTIDSQNDQINSLSLGALFYFPIKILNKGYVKASCSYAFEGNGLWILKCGAHWNLSRSITIDISGHIFKKINNLKYSGFAIGFAKQF